MIGIGTNPCSGSVSRGRGSEGNEESDCSGEYDSFYSSNSSNLDFEGEERGG